MSDYTPRFGWRPDYPSCLDFTPEHAEIAPHLTLVHQRTTARAPTLAACVDLRPWCSPIENQQTLGACTAHAGVGMIEYYERRAYGKHVDASRLFLYKTTRNLMKESGDTGGYLRNTMEAMVLFGVPPEEYWPYDIDKFDDEPSAFLYSFGLNYQALKYYRLDPAGTPHTVLLQSIKCNLAAGLPAMFGFTVYNSYIQASAANKGAIPYPTSREKIVGGHAVMAVGYDDTLVIKNSNSGAVASKGAILIRNSMGTGWGDDGYGWLPYDYVLKGLATDWWTLISAEYIATDNFG